MMFRVTAPRLLISDFGAGSINENGFQRLLVAAQQELAARLGNSRPLRFVDAMSR
jgi:hypothetical protein